MAHNSPNIVSMAGGCSNPHCRAHDPDLSRTLDDLIHKDQRFMLLNANHKAHRLHNDLMRALLGPAFKPLNPADMLDAAIHSEWPW